MIYLQEILYEITGLVKMDLALANLFFYHETPVQIVNDISHELNNTKYPFIALHRPFKDEKRFGYSECNNVSIVIADMANMTDDITTRYGNSFKTVIHPIMEAFIARCNRDFRLIKENNAIDYDFIDHPLWAVSNESETNDVINGTELTISFKIRQKTC
jgi:hypothetical protein